MDKSFSFGGMGNVFSRVKDKLKKLGNSDAPLAFFFLQYSLL